MDDNPQIDSLNINEKILDTYKRIGTAEDDLIDQLQKKIDLGKRILEGSKNLNSESNKLANIQKDISDENKKIAIALEEQEKFGTANTENYNRNILPSLTKILELEEKRTRLEGGIDIKKKTESLIDQIPVLSKIYKWTKDIIDLWTSNPILAVVSVLTALVNSFVKVFNEVDTAAANFRISMGFLRSDTSELEKNVRATYFDLAQTGVTAKDLYDSFQAIGQTIGTTQATTMSMSKDMALMSAQLGVAVGTSAEFERSMGMMARNTMDSQKNMALFTSKLSAAAGTNLNEVMGDVANATKTSYQFMTRSPLALSKAAVEAKRMGTSISDAARSAENLIDFTSSVKAEMEASVLLGESINLQRVRELSYRRDLAGVNKEILSIAQKAKFEELDPIQQKSVAAALGKSADELGKMLQADREMRRIRSDGSLSKQVADYDKLVGSNESIAKLQAESARVNLANLSNQASLKAISLALQAIYQHMFQPLVSLVSIVLPKIASWIQIIHEKTGAWGGALLGVVGILGIIIGTRGLGKIISWTTGGAGKAVKNLMGDAAEGVGKFGTTNVIKGAVGLILVASALIPFAFAMKLMQGIEWKTFFVAAASIGVLVGAVLLLGALMTGAWPLILAGAAAMVLIGASLIPVAYAFKLFGGALAELANVDLMSIAIGLMQIGTSSLLLIPVSMFLPLLATGFGALGISLRFAATPMERVGKAAGDLGEGLEKTANALEKIAGLSILQVMGQFKDLSTTISNISREVNAIPDIKIEKLQSIIVGAADVGAQQAQKSDDELLKAIGEVKDAIMSLKSSLEKGGISANVQIDTQKMDSIYARTMAFKGTRSPQPAFI